MFKVSRKVKSQWTLIFDGGVTALVASIPIQVTREIFLVFVVWVVVLCQIEIEYLYKHLFLAETVEGSSSFHSCTCYLSTCG